MRCGRELKNGSTFCQSCQEVMESCPVPQGTPIQLPSREVKSTGKKKNTRKHRELSPEEQVSRLRATCRWLLLALIVAVLAFAFTAGLLLHVLEQTPGESTEKGRNYTTVHRTGR
jgi:hypothetical protein